MKRIVSIITTAVLAAALGLTGSSPGWADDRDHRDDREPRSDRPVHLALGDSLAAGQASVPARGSVERTLARWRANGFVAQFHDALRDDLDCRADRPGHGREDRRDDGCRTLQLVNLSRTGVLGVEASGVTTTTLLAPGDQLDRAVEIITARNGDRSSRNDVEVVTLTVGGNDLFRPAIAACVPSAQNPDPRLTCPAALEAAFATVGGNYARILGALRATPGGGDLVILTTTYDNPLPFCDLGAAIPNGGAVTIGNAILEGGGFGLEGDEGFNDLIRGVSARFGATAVDTFGLLDEDDFVGGADCLHPDGSGHRAIAEAFAAAFPG